MNSAFGCIPELKTNVRRKYSKVAALSLCVAASLFSGGCGDGGAEKNADVAAINAALAVREAELEERLAALDPDAMEEARDFVKKSAAEAKRILSELLIDNHSDMEEQAATLARFRHDAEALVFRISEALDLEKDAVVDVKCEAKELASLYAALCGKEPRADFGGKTAEEFLEGFAGETERTRRMLSGWRTQRQEKIEDGGTATFPAFAESALTRYEAWESWANVATEVQRRILEDLLPSARGSASNLVARAADAVREREQASGTLAKLRSMSVSADLVEEERKKAIRAFDIDILGAFEAMTKPGQEEVDFPGNARRRAEECTRRAGVLRDDAIESASKLGRHLSAPVQVAAKTASDDAEREMKSVLKAVGSWEELSTDLERNGKEFAEAVATTRKTAEAIRVLKRMDEKTLVAGIDEIEKLRTKIGKTNAKTRQKDLSEKRKALSSMIGKTEGSLLEAERAFASAKANALAEKWAVEKNQLRETLAGILNGLKSSPNPGYVRPENKVSALKKTVGDLLSRVDSMGEEELRTAVKKAQEDFLVIETKTKWTVGTRHPERPHIFAATEDGKDVWNADPGYGFVEPGTINLDVVWKPGWRHPDHPHISAGQTEGTWVPDPGYKARWNGDLDPVWTKGMRHPTKPHVFAMEKEHMWDADPGYWFDNPSETDCDLVVSWRPGRSHPDHPHVSAGQTEGTWVPDPGYKARWNGDLDPVWTIGTRHPTRPHIFASRENGKDVWECDPGYVWVQPNSHNLDCYWTSGRRHPDHEGIESAQQEGKWNLLPGWTWVNPGTSNLDTRWVPGARFPGQPHIHASDNKWKWSADDGYDFDEYNSSNLSVHWEPGTWHSRYSGVIASRQEGCWESAAGWQFVVSGPSVRNGSHDLRAKWMPGTWHPTQRHVYASQSENRWSCEEGYTFVNPTGSDLSVRWTPGWISPDGCKRAKLQVGRFEKKQDCPSCENGYKTTWQECNTCRGTGKYFLVAVECPYCNGIGSVRKTSRCTNCNGEGWKWR